jgi:two-component system NtrC family response regulator
MHKRSMQKGSNTKKNFYSILDSYDKKIDQLRKKTKRGEITEEFINEYSYFRSLLEITHSINTPQGFNQLLELIVDSAISLTRAERGFLMLVGKESNLEFKVTRNIDRKTLEGEKFEISRTVVNRILATGEPLFLSDIYKNKDFEISESIEALGLRMVMCVPLKAKDKLLGIIYVDSHSETEHFTHLEEKMFEAFAAQASVAIENSHLYDLSIHDALTGLYNYGYLRNRLEEEIMRAQGVRRGNISFIMVDVDNFKVINDSYGHIFGNSILIKVAECIRKTVKKYDIPARYGGDEFAILMPDTDIQNAKQVAQKLQRDVTQLKFSYGKETLSLTMSIGVSSFPIEKVYDGETIIVEADRALFIAKSKGGNQIAEFGFRIDEKKFALEFIGESMAINEVKKVILKLARTDATILIIGETGTGKELITKLIHKQSARSDKPFVVVNCSAIPENLIESELFGHEKGSFTGAYKLHKGKFESAQGGTVFLDEIGELPLHLQVKLLRAIEQKEIERIGGKSPINVDIRLIAASNRNLESEVKKGNFRKDLFYRLSVATIYVPPLRDRPEDIETLSSYYLEQMNKRYRRKFRGFTKITIEAMMHHSWPGNVRELIHRIERAVIMGRRQYLDENDLGLVPSRLYITKTLKELKEQLEKEYVIQALVRNRWNVTRSSRELGISRRGLRDLIKKYNIAKSDEQLVKYYI